MDRHEELDQITRSLHNRGKLFLIGPRRYGKTSLLAAAETEASRDGVVVLRYDAERYESLELLAEALLTAATRRLATTVERAGTLLGRLAGRLRPELRYDPAESSFTISIAPTRDASASQLPVLVDVLDAIERMAAETERTVVVVIDEFQQVIADGGASSERQIRAAVQRHRHVGYVFAGSATRLLADMTGEPGRAFYRLGQRLFLQAIPRDDFRRALRTGFADSGFAVDDAALERILDVAADVPYSVQRLAHECWEMLRVSGMAARLTTDVVDQALERVLQQEDAAYTQIWTSLTLQQKRALKAVILEAGETLLSSRVSHRHKVPTASMQRALAALDSRALIRAATERGSARYRLEDPLLGHWLRWAQQLGTP